MHRRAMPKSPSLSRMALHLVPHYSGRAERARVIQDGPLFCNLEFYVNPRIAVVAADGQDQVMEDER